MTPVTARLSRPGPLLALLLVLATLVFVGGVLVERAREGGHSDEPSATEAGHAESEEGALLGVELEAPVLVLLAAGVSLALAALVVRGVSRPVLLLVAGFGLVFAVLDAREVLHQLDEACALVATLAAIAAVLHLGVTVVAGWLGRAEAPA